MPSDQPFQGVIGRTLEASTPWWPPLPSAPPGAPNVVIVLLDDVGYAQFGCYGSDIATPTFDKLAAGGVRYSNFHTTALCSPTRAALLTGRNHHSNGMGRIIDFATGFPGYDAVVPRHNGLISEILRENGYATFAVGKWHLTPSAEVAAGGPKDKWPLGRGFERYYGFLGGETDQFHPDLVYDNHEVHPPKTPEQGYHLTEDLVDHAQLFIKDLRATSPAKPYLLWFAPGACHAPHHAPREYIERYRGHFDQGWDAWRDGVFARQVASGLLPGGTELSERPSWVPAWDSLSEQERLLYARMMEVYAGFLTHTDAEVGRLLGFIEELGELDDTIVLVMSDNGASAEGGPRGSFNELYFFNFEPESLDENLRRIDELGSPKAYNHYPWGWAWAGNTPLKRWKRETHEGGVCDPLLVRLPERFRHEPGTRHQYVHAIDVLPTLLELVGIEPPAVIAGVPQSPMHGVSFTHTLDDDAGPTKHATQYYEMLGSRALYHDGWKAVVFHPMPHITYEETDDPGRSFEDDAWELYHVASDFSEVHNLAGSHPEKLAELVDMWWAQAELYDVLPVTNMPVVGMDDRYRRQSYTFLPGIGTLPQIVAPNLAGRPWRIHVELDVPEGGAEGAIVVHGSHAGGYAAYVRGGRLHFDYNHLGTQLTSIAAEVKLPPGPGVARIVFTPDGGHRGDVELFYGDVPVGSGHIPKTTLVTFGFHGMTVGHQLGSPVSPGCQGTAPFTAGALKRVVIETERRRRPGAPAEDRIGMATQ
ncbi:MAG: arylsulfatase [Acidimicrobiales bacterium]